MESYLKLIEKNIKYKKLNKSKERNDFKVIKIDGEENIEIIKTLKM